MAAQRQWQGAAATATGITHGRYGVGVTHRWQLFSSIIVAFAAGVALLVQPRGVVAERHVAAAAGHICAIQPGKEGTGVAACYGNPTAIRRLSTPRDQSFHYVTTGDDFSCGLTDQQFSVLGCAAGRLRSAAAGIHLLY